MCDVLLHLVLCSSIQAPSPRLYSASALPFGFSLHSASTTSPLPHSEIQTSEGFTGSTKCSHVFGVHRLHFRCLRIHIGSWFLVCSDTCAQFLRSASKGTVWPPHCQKKAPTHQHLVFTNNLFNCASGTRGQGPSKGWLAAISDPQTKFLFFDRRSKAGFFASFSAFYVFLVFSPQFYYSL